MIDRDPLASEDFWWLVGYLHGDGSLDRRNGIWLVSTDHEPIERAKKAVRDLFGLHSSFYVEWRDPPWKPKLKLAVYSRLLILWLDRAGLTFGEKRWKPPDVPGQLFCHYLAGLFDAEGQIMLGKNRFAGPKNRMIILHSINNAALGVILAKLNAQGVRSRLLERNRAGKPNPNYGLRIQGRQNIAWFVEHVGSQ